MPAPEVVGNVAKHHALRSPKARQSAVSRREQPAGKLGQRRLLGQQHPQLVVLHDLARRRLAPPGAAAAVGPRQLGDEHPPPDSLRDGIEDDVRLEELREARITGEGAGQLADEAAFIALLPQVVRAVRKERLRVHRRLLDARALVTLDLREQRPAVGGEPERLGLARIAQGHHDAPGGADGVGHATPGIFKALSQPLALQRIDRVLGELSLHVLPAEERADRIACRGNAVPGRHRQHHHVPMHPGPVRAGGLREVAARRGAWPAGLRGRLRAEHRVAELAVVAEVPWRFRQGVHARSGCLSTLAQASRAADFLPQPLLHRVAGHPLHARLVVHLLEVRAVPETPGPGQGSRGGALVVQVGVVQEPGQLPPAPERLLDLDGAGPSGADHSHQLRGVRLVADGLGVQEHRHHRLLHLALAEGRDLPLDPARDLELLLQQGAPVRPGSLRPLRSGDAGQIRHRLGYPIRSRRGQQGGRPDHRTPVPPFGVAERRRQGAENSTGALEPRQLRPAAVEHVAEVGVEGIALAEPLLLLAPIPSRVGVEARQGAHDADDLGAVRAGIAQAVRLEQAPAQHLRDVLAADGLHPCLLLPPDDVEEIGLERLAQPVLLAPIGGKQRRDESRAIHLGDRLHEGLEEVHDPLAPDLAHTRLAARVHEHLVDEDQGTETPLLRQGQELREERLGGRGLALLGLAAGVDRAEPVRPGKLEREDAPGMLERAGIAVRPPNPVDPPLDVDLVEAERHRERLRQRSAHVLPELLHRVDLGERGRVAEQVVEGDEGVGLAAAVGQLELPHRLGAPAREPLRHVLDQFAQGVGGVGQGEEARRVLVDGPPPLAEGDLVQVGGELRQGQLPAPQLALETHDLMPRLRSGGAHVLTPITSPASG